MPRQTVTATATGGGVTVRGGRKLARFLRRARALPATDDQRAAALLRVFENEIVPRLKAALPRRTGRLRNSVRAGRRGTQVFIEILFTWRWQRIGNPPVRPDEYVIDLINANRAAFTAALARELRAALGT